MPKEVRTAADILGTPPADAPVSTEAPAAAEVPVVETPAPSTEPTPPPPAGFEEPPPSAPAEEAPSAESVIAAAAELVAPAPAVVALPAVSAAEVLGAASTPPLDEPEQPELPVEAPPVVPVKKQWIFVKNIHPGEKIVLKDGTVFTGFQGATCRVADADLAAKILEVADIYHICIQ